MCITAPARVLEVDGDVAAIDIDGRRRLASLVVLPDVAPGDWVIVGAGTVLRRIDPADALVVRDQIRAARAAAALFGATSPPEVTNKPDPPAPSHEGDPR